MAAAAGYSGDVINVDDTSRDLRFMGEYGERPANSDERAALAVPLVHLLPAWEGAALWILVGGVGLALVLVATMLERGRAAVRAGNRRLHALTQGWE